RRRARRRRSRKAARRKSEMTWRNSPENRKNANTACGGKSGGQCDRKHFVRAGAEAVHDFAAGTVHRARAPIDVIENLARAVFHLAAQRKLDVFGDDDRAVTGLMRLGAAADRAAQYLFISGETRGAEFRRRDRDIVHAGGIEA